jgi:S-(hydroxymethyl)glutathione dehydrogenase/alcohol dehydrogenase
MKKNYYPINMSAAVLWKTGDPLSIENNIKIPQLERGQVLVKIAYSGVCRSQLMEVQGARGEDKYLPHLLGHEGSGQVVAIGAGVSKVSEGEWVILGWIKGNGIDALGAKYKLGDKVINSGAVTTFSNYSIVSENRLVLCPKDTPRDIATLFGCALPTGAGMVINEIKPKINSTIAIIGLGGVGLSALIAAKISNCRKIIAVDISNEKLNLAKQLGATDAINPLNVNVENTIMDITNGDGVDYSVEAAGRIETIELSFKLIKHKGGKCIFASHPEKGKKISIDPFELISGKTISGSWGGGVRPDEDIPKLSKLFNIANIPLNTLITKRYRLEQINEALTDLSEGRVFRPLIEMSHFV